MQVQQSFMRPLVDLGAFAGVQELGGAWVAEQFDPRAVDRYIQPQFREHAQRYVERFTDYSHFRILLDTALSRAGLTDFDAPLRVLDICSGAGNTVVPLLNIFPHAEVLATDLSVEMLMILDRVLRERGLRGRAGILQVNAEELDFAPDVFDLVVGAAALHHLIQPEKVLVHCGRILKKGGLAIFFEPFEIGNAMLAMIFREILDDCRSAQIGAEVRGSLEGFIRDIEARRGSDKSAPAFQKMDDKWLFTRRFFDDECRRAGLEQCTIYSAQDNEDYFQGTVAVRLRLSTGKTLNILPDWAWQIVRRYDAMATAHARQELLLVGCVILRKPR